MRNSPWVVLFPLLLLATAASGEPTLETPLLWAIANNDAFEAWSLTDPDGPGAVRPEPSDLSWAVTRGAGETFDVLTYRGAPANAILEDGRNLLFGAAEQGRLDLFRKILGAGAQLDQVDLRGFTLLHVGSASPRPVMLGYLLGRGLATTARTDLGLTPLMTACLAGRTEAVLTLLAWGANPDDEDYLGRAVLWYAQRGGNAETVAAITAELSPPEPEPAPSAGGALLPSLEQTPLPGPSTPEPTSPP